MASFTRLGPGRVRAQVYVRGRRASRVLPTMREAQAWAVQQESDLQSQAAGRAPPGATVGTAMARYRDRVSPAKRGHRWERVRLDQMLRDPLAAVALPSLSPADLADWRDRRLESVSPESVRREWTLLRHVLRVAALEWCWIDQSIIRLRMPPKSPPRDRRVSDEDLQRIWWCLGYEPDQPPLTLSARVGAAARWAVATAMRSGEICSLRWADVDRDRRVARLNRSKTRRNEEVPLLGPEPLEILEQLEPVTGGDERVFGLSDQQRSALWQRAVERAQIDDLHFHDTRAEALTRLSRRVDILTLARISGHRDLRMLQVYYRETAAEIAARLAE